MIVALDLETTGLNKDINGICQISMIKFDEHYKVVDIYNTYIKPWSGAQWSPSASEVTGITPETVQDSPTFRDVADQVLEFIGSHDILTYNGNSFDIPFLQQELRRVGKEFSTANRKMYDSFYIECQANPRRLESLYERYTGRTMKDAGLDAHDSLSDVKATISVFKKQKDMYDVDTICQDNTCGGVLSYDDSKRPLLRIGKYKGDYLEDVISKDPNYVTWLVKSRQDKDLFNIVKSTYSKVNKK